MLKKNPHLSGSSFCTGCAVRLSDDPTTSPSVDFLWAGYLGPTICGQTNQDGWVDCVNAPMASYVGVATTTATALEVTEIFIHIKDYCCT